MPDQVNASPSRLLTHAEAEQVLEYNFRLMNKKHPAVDAMYAAALVRLTSEPVPGGRSGSAVAPQDSETFDRLLSAAEALPPVEPLDLLRPEMQLPVLPAVLMELQSLMQQENSSAEQVAKVVLKDGSLAAWLLRLVNSAYYGFSGRIETVSRAVALLGFKQMQSVVSSGILYSLLSGVRGRYFNRRLFWRHSAAVAVLASDIWTLSKRKEPERLFVAGQLHDVGKLSLACVAPDHADVVWQLNEIIGNALHEQEQRYLGFDHAILGGVLLRKWNMPVSLVMAVLRHHERGSLVKYPETAVVHVADILAHSAGLGAEPCGIVPVLFDEAWQISGLSPENIESLLEGAIERINSLDSLIG